jgi:hypothetical protein
MRAIGPHTLRSLARKTDKCGFFLRLPFRAAMARLERHQ